MGKIRNFWIRKHRAKILKKRKKLRYLYVICNIYRKFKRQKKYSLILRSRSLLSVSSKTLRSTKYVSYFNNIKPKKTIKLRLRRLRILRRILSPKRLLAEYKKNYDNALKLPAMPGTPKNYQFIKLKYKFYKNYTFPKTRKKGRKKRYPSLLHICTAQFPMITGLSRVLHIRVRSYKKLYSLFKLFLFAQTRLRRRRKKRMKRRPRNRFHYLRLLNYLYRRKNFSFNLFRRTAKCLSGIKRKKLVNEFLPFNKNYNRRIPISLVKRVVYGFEVLGHKGPTTSQFLPPYKFVFLKLKKRVRYSFIKFHLLFPKRIRHRYRYYRRITHSFIPHRKKKSRRRRLQIAPNITLRAAKIYNYKLHYLTRNYIPFKKIFFKKKKFIPKIKSSRASKNKEKPIFTPKFIQVTRVKNFTRINLFTPKQLRRYKRLKHKNLSYKHLTYKFLYKNLYVKYFVRNFKSLDLYISNRNTKLMRNYVLRDTPLKGFNLLLFFRPKAVIIFFKEKLSQIVSFVEESRFVDYIFVAKIVRLLRLSVERLKIIHKKRNYPNMAELSRISEYEAERKLVRGKKRFKIKLVATRWFLIYFTDNLKRKSKRFKRKPAKKHRSPRYPLSEKIKKWRRIGFIKQSPFAKQKRSKVDIMLRRRKDVWLQSQFIMLNFKNLLTKRGLSARAEKVVWELLLLTKFKRRKKKINYHYLFLYRRPLFGVKPRRKGSMIQQIPMLLTSKRSISQAQRQLLKFASNRTERTLILRVYNECLSTIQNRSSSSKALADQYKSTFLNRVLL